MNSMVAAGSSTGPGDEPGGSSDAFPAEVELAELLKRHHMGKDTAQVVESMYQDIHRIARGRNLGQSSANTWQTTDIADEAFLRFLKNGNIKYRDRATFLALAARVIRNLLIENARSKGRQKRSSGGVRLPLDSDMLSHESRAVDLLVLDEALKELEKVDPSAARVVELRFFGDFTEAEVARIQGVSTRTVQRDWVSARAFLHLRLK